MFILRFWLRINILKYKTMPGWIKEPGKLRGIQRKALANMGGSIPNILEIAAPQSTPLSRVRGCIYPSLVSDPRILHTQAPIYPFKNPNGPLESSVEVQGPRRSLSQAPERTQIFLLRLGDAISLALLTLQGQHIGQQARRQRRRPPPAAILHCLLSNNSSLDSNSSLC